VGSSTIPGVRVSQAGEFDEAAEVVGDELRAVVGDDPRAYPAICQDASVSDPGLLDAVDLAECAERDDDRRIDVLWVS